jgi:hypothetical protein
MKFRAALALSATGIILAGLSARSLHAQQSASNLRPMPAACGAGDTNFKTTRDTTPFAPIDPPPGKALVYVIEQMPQLGIYTTKVKVGIDGTWLGETQLQSFISFDVDPGVHHLCAMYEGQALSTEMSSAILHRLNVEAGKTYYLLYRGLVSKDSGEVGFFDEVDEDEGRHLLQSSDRMTSVVKK